MTARCSDIPAQVRSVAAELLELPDISLDEDFFTAGGDSMLAMHLVGRLARATGLRLRIALLVTHPVLRDFAAQVQRLREQSTVGSAGAV